MDPLSAASAVTAIVTVLAHHLSGPIALAFALPPILLVGGVVLWLRRREPSEEEEFDWEDELERDAADRHRSAA